VKDICYALIVSSKSRVLFLNSNFINLAPLWADSRTIKKCVTLLYFHHGLSREMLSKFNFTYSCDHL